MGYTHYFYQKRDLEEDEWRALTGGFRRLLTLDGVPPLARYDEDHPTPPEITDDVICFNGVGDEGHETCVIERINEGPQDYLTNKSDGRFNFCKTACKPYDVVVTAVLAYLDSSVPDAFAVSSDGDEPDWQDGIALARQAWPEVDIEVPRRVVADEEDEESLA